MRNNNKCQTLLNFQNFILFAIILIYLSNTFFSYSLSVLETNRRMEIKSFVTSLTSVDKETKESLDILKKLDLRIKDLNDVINKQIIQINKAENEGRRMSNLISGTGSKIDAVKEAMQFAWAKYKKYAWGQDELNPLSKNGKNWMGLGLTILDSIDTLHIMGLKQEYEEAKEFVVKMNFESVDQASSVFEMNIRVLGGLLATYTLTEDITFLNKAKEFGDILMHAWDDKVYPFGMLNPKTKAKQLLTWSGGSVVLADIGSLQMEFCTLSYFTKDHKYCKKVMRIIDFIQSHSEDGLSRCYYNYYSSNPHSKFTIGGLSDSYYEYLLKMWLLTNKKVPKFRQLYDQAVEGAKRKFVVQADNGVVFLKDEYENSMEHLACFAGGMFALGAKTSGKTQEKEMDIGRGITSACHEMYKKSKTGLGPETIRFDGNNFSPGHTFYILRPETVESYFVLWRLTQEQKYRDWGWEAFLAVNTSCRGENGFHGLHNVDDASSRKDPQESFFLAETLKYFYLLFAEENEIPLNDYIFNTEAHPLAVWKDDESTWISMFDEFVGKVKY